MVVRLELYMLKSVQTDSPKIERLLKFIVLVAVYLCVGGCTHGLLAPLTSPTSAVDLLLRPCTSVHVTGVASKPPSKLFFALTGFLGCSDLGNLQDSPGAEPSCCPGSGPAEVCCSCGRQDANIRRVVLLCAAKFHILIRLLSHPVVEACLAFLISLLQLGSWETLTFK